MEEKREIRHTETNIWASGFAIGSLYVGIISAGGDIVANSLAVAHWEQSEASIECSSEED